MRKPRTKKRTGEINQQPKLTFQFKMILSRTKSQMSINTKKKTHNELDFSIFFKFIWIFLCLSVIHCYYSNNNYNDFILRDLFLSFLFRSIVFHWNHIAFILLLLLSSKHVWFLNARSFFLVWLSNEIQFHSPFDSMWFLAFLSFYNHSTPESQLVFFSFSPVQFVIFFVVVGNDFRFVR